MQYIYMARRVAGGYEFKKASDANFEILGFFLLSDVGSSWISSWRDWIKNPEYEDTASNSTFLEKEGDKIIMGDLHTEEDQDPYEFLFETTQEQLLEILNKWEELCKQQPKKIIITKEGDKVMLEGRD